MSMANSALKFTPGTRQKMDNKSWRVMMKLLSFMLDKKMNINL
jgi:hypothetical protein